MSETIPVELPGELRAINAEAIAVLERVEEILEPLRYRLTRRDELIDGVWQSFSPLDAPEEACEQWSAVIEPAHRIVRFLQDGLARGDSFA
jgi:hypothetical protein